MRITKRVGNLGGLKRGEPTSPKVSVERPSRLRDEFLRDCREDRLGDGPSQTSADLPQTSRGRTQIGQLGSGGAKTILKGDQATVGCLRSPQIKFDEALAFGLLDGLPQQPLRTTEVTESPV